ncbi:hypothetical protein FHY55_17895 [Oceanicola sp. D3]|uniref:YrhK family protein n=1 Tax=Oceanicola sp. D3 TaxID=2587163 RepID=UPI00111CDFCC|nr:YrhK family protein [Oceanicola sp. D3]QDC10990.1 hypothetical protein FHY55_17895 [Oceanicola sp. D3]
MKLFRHENRERNHDTRRIYALYELAYTLVDFGAATCFLIGSALFFWPAWETPAVWLFTIGSLLFFAKPAIRLAREVKLLRMGKYETLAERMER